jgi:O-antigen ligase
MINFFLSIENIVNETILGLPRYWLTRFIIPWLRSLIIIGVLLVTIAVAYKGSTRILQLMLILPVGIAVVLLFIRWPPLGLLGLIGSIIIPINGPSNSNATLAIVAFLSGLWIFDMMVHRQKIELPSSKSAYPLLALVLVALFAFGIGQLPWYTFAQPAPLGAQLGGLALYILSACVFLLAVYYIRDVRWLEWMTWLFLALGAVFILGKLVPVVGRFTGQFFTVQATGSLFWTWLIIISFSQAAFNNKLHWFWRLAVGGVSLLTLYVTLTQNWAWNSGWVPPLVAIAAILWAASPKLGLLATLVGLAGGVTKAQKLTSMVMADNEYSLGTRVDAWIVVWEIVKVNPFLGLGPANYHWYTPLFPIRGYAVKFNSHSQYVDLIAQTGILGLLCFLWFFGVVGWLGWQLRQRVPEGFPRAYVYGAIGGVAGTLTSAALGDWVIPFFYNINLGGFRASMLSWLFLGGLVALEQIFHQPDNLEAGK